MIELYTDSDFISIDLLNNEIRKNNVPFTYDFTEERDDYQRAELDHFFDILEGKVPNDNSVSRALKTVNLAMGVIS